MKRIFCFLLLLFAPQIYAQTILVVVQKGDNSLGFYQAETGQPVGSVTVGIKPHEIALSADQRFGYVTDYGVDNFAEKLEGGKTISVVDMVKREKVGQIDLGEFRRPHGIERGHSGLLYVTCDFPANLLVVDPVKKTIKAHYPLDQMLPHMLAINKDESKAYVANAGSGTVSIIDLKSKGVIKNVTVGGVPMGLALTSDNKTLYATSSRDDRIAIIDTAKGELKGQIEVKGGPARLRLLPDEKQLLVTLIGSGEVALIDTSSLQIVNHFAVGKGAEGITLDPDTQNLFVSAQGENKIGRFSLPGWKPLQEIKTGAKPDPIVVIKSSIR